MSLSETIIMVFNCILIILTLSVSLVSCREFQLQNTTSKELFQPSIINDIQSAMWNEFMDPLPFIIALISYTVLKFTGVFGFLRVLYTIINQSNT